MSRKIKKIVFLTGTRADYGKLKPLITAAIKNSKFKVIILVTGMHLQKKFGSTYLQIINDFKKSKIYKVNNHINNVQMDDILANTLKKVGKTIKKIKPDLVIIHGDRVETLATTITCNLNNILTCHIEGGEVSGTVDESIRHSTTKLAHAHFVSNSKAKKILIRMGELKKNIYVIGSPEVDIMLSKNLPSKNDLKKRYNIKFKDFAIFLFHPVTTLDKKEINKQCKILKKVIQDCNKNFIVILPNNDTFSEIIHEFISNLKNLDNVRVLPSLRFEYFLTLLKNSQFILGNSSSGIREAPVYGIKTINLGTRQKNRSDNKNIINLNFNYKKILNEINKAKTVTQKKFNFGHGNTAKNFIKVLKKKSFWLTDKQKNFSKN